MEEDIDTRKINNSFLRDHSYATEGNVRPSGVVGGKKRERERQQLRSAAGRRLAKAQLRGTDPAAEWRGTE